MAEESQVQSGLGAVVTPPKSKGGFSVPGNVALDPTQTESILANMQRIIDERESPLNLFTSGLKDALAYAAVDPTRNVLARDEQKMRESQELLNMRSQIASVKAAQEQQKAFEARKAKELGGTPGVGGTGGGINMPDEIKLALSNARTREEYDKIYNAWAQKQAEVSANPEMDVPKIPVVVENPDGSFTRKVISVREYRANPNLYKDAPETQQALKSVPADKSGQPVSVRNNNPGNLKDPKTGEFLKFDTLEAGQKALDEDTKLKLSGQSPAVKQRFGDVNIITPAMLAETWSPATAPGNSPESTANYAKFIAGKLGIDPTAPIPNTEEARKRVNEAITEFESGQKAPAAPAAVTPTTTAAKGPKPTPEQMESESKVKQTFREKQAAGAAENVQKAQLSFETVTEPSSVSERKTSAERVEKLVLDNPTAAGIIAKPGVANALLTIIRDGLNTPSGAIGIKTIEDALVLTMPGTDQKTINARREIAQNLAKGALEASKLSQGQGSVSDFERSMFERIAGSLADTPELLVKRQRMLVARANLDSELGKMYRGTKKPGEPLDFDTFRTSKEYETKVAAYEKELRSILDSEVQIKGTTTASKHPGASLLNKYPSRTNP
ncbi:MAG: hypothetical protein EBR60_09730 [Burkholderiaceae bacterium]|nr:hypothetical protein [Burkholderiaceae bacterium]